MMDRDLRRRMETFLRPFYQDLDGASRFDDVERIARNARKLYVPDENDARAFELLQLFHRLGFLLEKVGNLSRTLLGVPGLTETELRRHARAVLPAALVPHVFVELSELPRDAQGQVDQPRLPSPFAAPLAAHIPARTPSEKLLAKLFLEVLGVPRVGVHDNFFDLGGQSLLCLRVIDMIERETKRRMSPRILLLNTLEQAAAALDQLQGGQPEEKRQSAKEETGVAGRVLKGLRGLLGG